MRHLITGGGGFIGSHLADALLARGDEVTGWFPTRTLDETIEDVVAFEKNRTRVAKRASLAP